MAELGRTEPAFYRRRQRRQNEIGQLLLKRSAITPEQLRAALGTQAEQGGQVGAILREMGACSTRDIVDALMEQSQPGSDPGLDIQGLARRAKASPENLGLTISFRPRLVTTTLVLSDVVSLLFGAFTVGGLESLLAGAFFPIYGVMALMPLSVSVFAAALLYGTPPPAPHEELRRLSLVTTLVYAGCWTVTTLVGGRLTLLSNAAWLVGWLATLVLVPMARGLVRSLFGKRSWWGFPVVVLGAGKVGRAVVSKLQRRPELGLRPVAILDDDPAKQGTLRVIWGEDDLRIAGSGGDEAPASEAREVASASRRLAWEQFAEVDSLPVLGGFELAPILAQRLGIKIAVIADPELDSTRVLNIIEAYADSYTNVLVIPDLFDLSQFGAPSQNLGGVLGIEVRRKLLLSGPRFAKRLMDVTLTVLGGLAISPILILLGLLVKLDSPGSVFYRQARLGQDGVRFFALKFRTMHGDGEPRLKEVLERDPALLAEYEQYHKLANDPRVTRIGRILRKYSLDELPQLWNVLVNEMSLVGPRPYLPREIPEMNQQECLVLRVKPGLTGFWQVTERNSSTFARRVQMDVEYVRNWSPWLDIYVLARTIPVVLGGTGS